MANKRNPQRTPGPACTELKENEDLNCVPSMYYDSIEHYDAARIASENDDFYRCNRFKRAAISAAFMYFEAQLNQLAFAYAETHQSLLGEIERDVLEEMETSLGDSGEIIRKNRFYRTEDRFCFLTLFLTGQKFDRGGELWDRFRTARKLRDSWTHPKPPFDTWALELQDVRGAIIVVRDMYIRLSEMMDTDPPHWLRPFDDVLAELRKTAG